MITVDGAHFELDRTSSMWSSPKLLVLSVKHLYKRPDSRLTTAITASTATTTSVTIPAIAIVSDVSGSEHAVQ